MRGTINHAWRTLWQPVRHRDDPLWARVLVASSMAITAGLALVLLSGLLHNKAMDLGWWHGRLAITILVCCCVACVALACNGLLAALLPAHELELVAGRRDWRAAAYLNVTLVGGTVIGFAVGLTLAQLLLDADVWQAAANPQEQARFLAFLAVLATICIVGERLHVRQRDLQQKLAQSRLRLLQAQVEPRYLFDTLADVHQLVADDPQRAKLVLEELTDHLRENLGRLRDAENALAAMPPQP